MTQRTQRLLGSTLIAICAVAILPVLLYVVLFGNASAYEAAKLTPWATAHEMSTPTSTVDAAALATPLREVDATQPAPTVRIRLHLDPADGYTLELLTTDFAFAADASARTGRGTVGYAQIYINGRAVQSLHAATAHLPRALFVDGVNTVGVTLNASDGAIWTRSGTLFMDEVSVAVASAADGEDATQPAESGAVRYTLDWAWGDAQPDDAGTGWHVTSELGYRIHVTEGYLTSSSVAMVACDHDHADSQVRAVAELLLDWAGLGTAQAGHGDAESDASRIVVSQVESLTAPTPIQVEAPFGAEPFYCQAHYLVAPGDPATTIYESGSEMQDLSVRLVGEYQAPGSDEVVPFTLQTELAWGAIVDVQDPSAENGASGVALALPRGEDVQITIRRELGTLFDGVDFATMSPAEQARAVLRALTQSITVEIAE